jgi:iron complex transport system ATP-binding protein
LVGLSVHDLTVRYGAHVAAANVSFEARRGEILAIVGPNGSGKSSILKAIAGVQPYTGAIREDGRSVGAFRIGFMPQDGAVRAALTVFETVLLGRFGRLGLRVAKRDLDAVDAMLAELEIGHLAERYISDLSGGQRQLAFLAQALAAEPGILLLDEPTSALDIRNQLEVRATVRRLTRARGLATVCVLHDLSAAAQSADRILAMSDGRAVACDAPEIVLTPARIAAVFGVEARVSTDPDGFLAVAPVRAIPATARARPSSLPSV